MREEMVQSWFVGDQSQIPPVSHVLHDGTVFSDANYDVDRALDGQLDKLDTHVYDVFDDNIQMFGDPNDSNSILNIYHSQQSSTGPSSQRHHESAKSISASQYNGTTVGSQNKQLLNRSLRAVTSESSTSSPSNGIFTNQTNRSDQLSNISSMADFASDSIPFLKREHSTPLHSIVSDSKRPRVSPKEPNFSTTSELRANSSIPARLDWAEYARQGVLAAYSSRINPYALHLDEYQLLRSHITESQVTAYINIRNGILRLWHRSPLVAVTKQEAAGCAREPRHFPLALVAYEWLLRSGYINFGCVDVPSTLPIVAPSKGKIPTRQKTIIVIGAGMSGLGCARHLEHLFQYYAEEFASRNEIVPKVIVLEGRRRIGGRVFSHPLAKNGGLPKGMRSTAEMGAQIVTGFDHGNPMNIIIRGQLGLPYAFFKDNKCPLYDHDGKPVDEKKDSMVENLWNDILERASNLRSVPPKVKTIAGDRMSILRCENPKESSSADGPEQFIAAREEAGEVLAIDDGNPIIMHAELPQNSALGTQTLAGRQYNLVSGAAKLPGAQAAVDLGFKLHTNVNSNDTIHIEETARAMDMLSLGKVMDEGVSQYQRLIELSPQEIRLLNWHHANMEYANATSLNNLSLTDWDQDIGNEFEGRHAQVVGGYTQVPRGLWKLPHELDVRFEHEVTRVFHNHAPKSRKPAVTVECSDGKQFDADELVFTAPLGVLKHGNIQFEPPLPDWKTDCIDRMEFGLLNKVVLVYDECFWNDKQDMFGLLNHPGSTTMEQTNYANRRGRFYLLWNIMRTSGRPVLVALMTGESAVEAETTSTKDLVDEITGRLTQAFSPKKVPYPSEVIVTRWRKDPFSRGSYSYVGSRTQQGDYDLMSQPCGPIHFAGEATCATHPATVHGAYISGLRAASEVIESILGPIIIPQTPLVSLKTSKAQQSPIATSPKRKAGYVHIWEPINKVDPFFASIKLDNEQTAYESQIENAITAAIGPRPIPPTKAKINPYIRYSNDRWYESKTKLEQQRTNPNVKVTKNEIRAYLGQQWKNAPDEIKKAYKDKCDADRRDIEKLSQEFSVTNGKWEEQARKLREDFVRDNPPPVTQGSGRKARKLTY